MTCSITHNGRFPTDPITALALLFAASHTISQLTPEQVDAFSATLSLAAALVTFLTRERN
jgi:hypothetical protein